MSEERVEQAVRELEQTAEQLEAKVRDQQERARRPFTARIDGLVHELSTLNEEIDGKQRELVGLAREASQLAAHPGRPAFRRDLPWGLALGGVVVLVSSNHFLAAFLAGGLFLGAAFAARLLGSGK